MHAHPFKMLNYLLELLEQPALLTDGLLDVAVPKTTAWRAGVRVVCLPIKIVFCLLVLSGAASAAYWYYLTPEYMRHDHYN
jgi:hypothetical protein